MTKPINEYTVKELSAKIEAIKAERERIANALKKYEEELERRKQEVPLGVPCDGEAYVDWRGQVHEEGYECVKDVAYNSFSSYESAEKHAEILLDWRKALVANAKGEPIDIKVLLPLLKKGYVAMDEGGCWYWYEDKPEKRLIEWVAKKPCAYMFAFNLKPAENWEDSLTECGL